MKSLEYYKNAFGRAVIEGFVEYPKKEKTISNLSQEVALCKGKYRRLVALLSLVKETMPTGLADSLSKRLDNKDYSKLPFKESDYQIKDKIGNGWVSNVYLLESKLAEQPSLVIKFLKS